MRGSENFEIAGRQSSTPPAPPRRDAWAGHAYPSARDDWRLNSVGVRPKRLRNRAVK